MHKCALDTNVYIDALRSEDAAALLERFLVRELRVIYLSAIVMQELRGGARTRAQVNALERGVFRPFERRGRVLVPSATAFKEAGRAVAERASRSSIRSAGRVRVLMSDALLAASCRENDVTLITRDSDFVGLARALRGFAHVTPWPGAT